MLNRSNFLGGVARLAVIVPDLVELRNVSNPTDSAMIVGGVVIAPQSQATVPVTVAPAVTLFEADRKLEADRKRPPKPRNDGGKIPRRFEEILGQGSRERPDIDG